MTRCKIMCYNHRFIFVMLLLRSSTKVCFALNWKEEYKCSYVLLP